MFITDKIHNAKSDFKFDILFLKIGAKDFVDFAGLYKRCFGGIWINRKITFYYHS